MTKKKNRTDLKAKQDPKQDRDLAETFDEKMASLNNQLTILIKRGEELDRKVLSNLEKLGFTGQ